MADSQTQNYLGRIAEKITYDLTRLRSREEERERGGQLEIPGRKYKERERERECVRKMDEKRKRKCRKSCKKGR